MKHNIKPILIKPSATIKEALLKLDNTGKQILLVVNDNTELLGTISDGDIRRAFLSGKSLDDLICPIMESKPVFGKEGKSLKKEINIAKRSLIKFIPILDNDGKVKNLKSIEELYSSNSIKTNKTIIMAGGLGSRLYPLTKQTPKPMLLVGGKPILETIIQQLSKYGFNDIILCLNYKSNVIENYFKNGKNFGVNIEYILEDKRLGTAGALSLISPKPDNPFIIMNGDILTTINFENLFNYHLKSKAIATMCVRESFIQSPFGVVNMNKEKIIAINEKPLIKQFINAGIYSMSPEAFEFIPKNQFLDMPSLLNTLIIKNLNVVSFPIHEHWVDIGQNKDFEKANYEYKEFYHAK